ncbi:28 kDa ribonucleoprotein, chloroplastic-like [Dioscorea cayenensis subsp. rotundata]|uniref:28 kDa ribonucleoprotein, chloroplastic-like n=1 Tax=Dioscorea cayennensis subsp. rotundata TaxID=55577 RepID=A0AB40BRC8_DIOCR|nr:28 kDa ribonucleoprotein, chloroplastic-like [Dioscorea cayenensis subsp. rotundata]
MAATPALKVLSMAEACLTSLPSTIFASKTPQSLVSIPPRPIYKPLLHLYVSPSTPFLSLKKSSSLIPLVAQTSDFARQDEEGTVVEAEGVDPLVDWESDGGEDGAVEAEGEVEEDGGEGFYPEPPEEAKLFVGNIPDDVDSEKLAHLFEGAGIVDVAEVIYDRNTQQSRGFGFVTMSTVEEAQRATEMFHRYDVGGRLLTVNKAAPRGTRPERRDYEPSFRIYVGNLPWQVDDARLEQVFSEHGKVEEARVVYERETGRSRGFGFVKMATRTEMDDAIAALDGHTLDGRALRVNVAEERPRRRPF